MTSKPDGILCQVDLAWSVKIELPGRKLVERSTNLFLHRSPAGILIAVTQRIHFSLQWSTNVDMVRVLIQTRRKRIIGRFLITGCLSFGRFRVNRDPDFMLVSQIHSSFGFAEAYVCLSMPFLFDLQFCSRLIPLWMIYAVYRCVSDSFQWKNIGAMADVTHSNKDNVLIETISYWSAYTVIIKYHSMI